ncbi:MAG TPA: hypothetical protein VNA69_11770 [Thermoanaerobaculia bacterium]|nr:hypothetical protein [Thermoanaerobaculia bacterium]
MPPETPDVAVFRYLYRLILRFGKKAPAPLQAFVFFLLVMFFLYTCFRFIGGDFAVRGRFTTQVVDANGKPQKAYASGLEVCLGDKMFATNSKGMFYAVLTPWQYYSLLATGRLQVDLGRAERPLGEVTLEYIRGSSSFDDEFLDPQQYAHRATPAPSFFEVVPAAYAGDDAPPPSSNRLFIDEIELDPRIANVRSVELELEVGGDEYDLRSVIGGEAGELPLTAGVPYRLGSAYFFPVSPSLRPTAFLKIELSSDTSFFFNDYEEDFVFTLPRTFGAFTSRGEGTISRLRLLYLSPVDFVVSHALDKSRLARMRSALENAGIRMVDTEPTRSAVPDRSNVLYVEKSVPAKAAVATLRAIRDAGIPLHAVQYPARKQLRPYELQLMTDSAARAALTPAQIDALLLTRTESDLARQVASLAVN